MSLMFKHANLKKILPKDNFFLESEDQPVNLDPTGHMGNTDVSDSEIAMAVAEDKVEEADHLNSVEATKAAVAFDQAEELEEARESLRGVTTLTPAVYMAMGRASAVHKAFNKLASNKSKPLRELHANRMFPAEFLTENYQTVFKGKEGQCVAFLEASIKETAWKIYDTIVKYIRKIINFVRGAIAKLWFYFKGFTKEAEKAKDAIKTINSKFDVNEVASKFIVDKGRAGAYIESLSGSIALILTAEFDTKKVPEVINSISMKNFHNTLKRNNTEEKIRSLATSVGTTAGAVSVLKEVSPLAGLNGWDIDSCSIDSITEDIKKEMGLGKDEKGYILPYRFSGAEIKFLKFNTQEDLEVSQSSWSMNTSKVVKGIESDLKNLILIEPSEMTSLLTFTIQQAGVLKEDVTHTMGVLNEGMNIIDRMKHVNNIDDKELEKKRRTVLKVIGKSISSFASDYLYGKFNTLGGLVKSMKMLTAFYSDVIADELSEDDKKKIAQAISMQVAATPPTTAQPPQAPVNPGGTQSGTPNHIPQQTSTSSTQQPAATYTSTQNNSTPAAAPAPAAPAKKGVIGSVKGFFAGLLDDSPDMTENPTLLADDQDAPEREPEMLKQDAEHEIENVADDVNHIIESIDTHLKRIQPRYFLDK